MDQIVIRTKDVMSIQQAANAMGEHRTTFYRRIRAGQCLTVVFGGTTYVPTSEVERLKKLAEPEETQQPPDRESGG